MLLNSAERTYERIYRMYALAPYGRDLSSGITGILVFSRPSLFSFLLSLKYILREERRTFCKRGLTTIFRRSFFLECMVPE